jgi:hypothetical protein
MEIGLILQINVETKRKGNNLTENTFSNLFAAFNSRDFVWYCESWDLSKKEHPCRNWEKNAYHSVVGVCVKYFIELL